MYGAKSAGTSSRWRATWRIWRTASHARHASAAITKAMKKAEKAAEVTWRVVTQSGRGCGQDPVGLDRHGDVGPRSRARTHSRGRDGGHRRRAEHHRRGARLRAAPARRGARRDGFVEQVHARQVRPG